MGGHPWDQAKVSVHDRWPLIRGTGWLGLRQTHYNSIMQPTRDIHSEYMHWCIMHGIIMVPKINEITMYSTIHTYFYSFNDFVLQCPRKSRHFLTLSVIPGADNQQMTVRVRVRQVAADRRYFNVEMCRDIDNVSVHDRWSLTTGVAQGRYYCIYI